MQANWIVIVVVLILAIGLVIYLIRQNKKDEKEVAEFFDQESSNFQDDESDLNDEK